MSTQLRTLGKHTLVYTAGIVIGKLASFVMLPIYTRYLTPSDYGVLELLGMTIDVIGMVTGAGILAGVFKFYHAKEKAAEKNAVISTAALSITAFATATTLIGLLISPELSRMIFGSLANLHYLRLYFLLFLFQNLELIPLALIRAENRAVFFVTANTVKLVMMLSLNIFFVVYLRMGVGGVITSGMIASGVMGGVLTLYLVQRVGLTFNGQSFRELLAFGTPLVPWWLGNFVLVYSDRYFLNYYSNTSTVGIYSLAYKFAFLLSALAYSPFDTVWASQRFEIAKRPDAQELYARVFLYMNVVLGGIGLMIALFVRDFLSIMSAPAFLPAYRLVPLLVAAQVLFTWAMYWSLGIYLSGKTKSMATGSVVLVPLTLILNYALIPRFGMYGAAWATLLAYSARFGWIYWFGERYYPIGYRWTEMAKLYGILSLVVALAYVYRPKPLEASLAYSSILVLISIVLVYTLVLSANERTTIKSLARNGFPFVQRALGNVT
jgi:O-antigen/teichoic acid export membrane protein